MNTQDPKGVTEKKTYSLEQAEAHMKNFQFVVEEARRLIAQCIDGRNDIEDNEAVSSAGADIGEVEAMTFVQKTLQEKSQLNKEDITILRNIITEVVGGKENLRVHTSDHVEEGCHGCGHFNEGLQAPEDYGLTAEEMKTIHNIVEEDIKAGIKNIELRGKHTEQAVLIVNSETHSIHNKNTDGDNVFIYHKTFVDQRNALIASKMKEKLFKDNADITEESISKLLNETMFNHLETTAQKIAGGLPVYEVNIDEKEQKIKYIKNVPLKKVA